MGKRYIRPEERIGLAIKRTRASVRDVQRPTGTEKARTKDVAEQAAVDSTFAKDLAEQLETELGPLPGQVQDALDEAAQALSEAGLARSDAAGAVADAQQAVADAAEAISEALAAASVAEAAQTAADGKSTVVRSPSPATAAGSYKQGDQWWQFSGGNIVGLWLHSGSDWVSQALTNAIIATLDAGKITTGTLAADRIGALSITAAKIAADAITTEKIAALAVTAAEIAADAVTAVKIAANAVTAEKINAGAVTTDKLNALAVTAEKIAAGAIVADKVAANAITTAKLAADAIDGMTITGALLRTAETGQRVQLDTTGLRTFNASNDETSRLSAETGGFYLEGDMRSFSEYYRYDPNLWPFTQDTEEIIIGSSGLKRIGRRYASIPGWMRSEFTFDGNGIGLVDGSETGGGGIDPVGISRASLLATGLYLTTDPTGISQMSSSYTVEGVQLASDIPWTMADASGSPVDRAGLRNGWTNQVNVNWNGLQTKRKLDVTYVTGAIKKSTAYAALEVVAVLPVALRPAVPTMVPAAYVTSGGYVLVRANGEIVTAQSGAGGQIAMAGSLVT